MEEMGCSAGEVKEVVNSREDDDDRLRADSLRDDRFRAEEKAEGVAVVAGGRRRARVGEEDCCDWRLADDPRNS